MLEDIKFPEIEEDLELEDFEEDDLDEANNSDN